MTMTVLGSDVLNLPDHHGQPMTATRNHTSWEGEYEITHVEARCSSCPTTLTMTLREHVGPPPARREDRRG